MKLIQIFFIFGFFPFLFLAIRLRKIKSGKLILRLGLISLVFSYFIALIFPSYLDRLANLLGIGRGADLILYGTAASLLFFIIVVIAKVNQLEEKNQKIVREIAILRNLKTSEPPRD